MLRIYSLAFADSALQKTCGNPVEGGLLKKQIHKLHDLVYIV
jgi:hypothetical protein